MSSPLLQVSYSAPALLAVQPLEGFTGCCWNRSFPSVAAHSSSFSPALRSASTDIHLLSGQPDGGRMGRGGPLPAYTHTHTYTHTGSDNQTIWLDGCQHPASTQQMPSPTTITKEAHGGGAHARLGQQLCFSEPLFPHLQTGGDENPNLLRPQGKLIDTTCMKCPDCFRLWQPEGQASWPCLHLQWKAVVAI